MDQSSREPALKADAFTQLRLLDLQEQDTRLGQLSHRRSHLPDAARLADLNVQLSRVDDEVVAAQTIASDLEREQDRAERDVATVVERMQRDQQLLDSGTIADPRQLQSLQAELESLVRRRSDLEDVELEIMERVDGASAAVAVLTQQRTDLAVERDEVAAAVAAQQSEIDAERAEVEQVRAQIAAELPADLLALYDKVRADHGGVGAAPLHRGSCQGCHLALPPNEIEEIRAAAVDAVLRCEECRRILVRAPESGL